MARRVVITGLGAVTPLGLTAAETWAGALEGRSGVGPITRFDAEGYRSRIAGELKGYEPTEYFTPKEIRRMDPFVQYALIASREAVADAGLEITNGLGERVAVLVSSGIGGIQTISEQTLALQKHGPARITPFLIPMILPDTASGMVALEFGLKGPNMSVASACASAANAIGESYEMVRRGAADLAVCGGTEAAVVPIAVAGFAALRALSERNSDPGQASRPFDRDRDGFVIAEGSAVLVIEELEHARARGARVYAELSGYASTDDAYHITAPDENGAGAVACMRMALDAARIAPDDVDYVNAHGTSTPLNDVTETRAIKQVLGHHAYRIPVSSTKSTTGHLLGAAGGVEAIFCAKALAEGVLPPTMNLDNPDPECDLDYVPNQARDAVVRYILSNSFGFGGHNACLVFGKL